VKAGDDITRKAEQGGLFCSLTEQQVAVLVNLSPAALQKQREASRAKTRKSTAVPFRRSGKKVVYYLSDLLRWEVEQNGLPLPLHLRQLALLMGEDFCREIGMPISTPKHEASASEPMPASLLSSLLMQVGSTKEQEPNKRGPKSLKDDNKQRKKLESMGISVRRNICRFTTLNDFIRRAEPEEQWLFCVPASGRPYDFMDAILEGGTEAPFVWLSLSDFLGRLSRSASDDRDARLSGDEYREIYEGTPIAEDSSEIQSSHLDSL